MTLVMTDPPGRDDGLGDEAQHLVPRAAPDHQARANSRSTLETLKTFLGRALTAGVRPSAQISGDFLESTRG